MSHSQHKSDGDSGTSDVYQSADLISQDTDTIQSDGVPNDLVSQETTQSQSEGIGTIGTVHGAQLASEETLDELEHDDIKTDDGMDSNGFNHNGYDADADDQIHIRCSTPEQAQRCACCTTCIRPCLLSTHEEPCESATKWERLSHAFLCPPYGNVATVLSMLLALAIFYGALWALTGDQALPQGNFFSLLVLIVAALIGGELSKLANLPALFGMLIVGFLLRNIPKISVAQYIDPTWSEVLRTDFISFALVIILIRAGLGLDPVALKKMSGGVFRLAFGPCLVEASCAAITSHFLLGFPWNWGFMLGFVLAAVSPAVVVPGMLNLQDKYLGVEQGIPTLVMAAASIDDVLAISAFMIVHSITFSTGGIGLVITKGFLLEPLGGIVYGLVLGVLCWYLPELKNKWRTLLQTVILFGGGLFVMFGSRAVHFAGAGALGCLVLGFVAAVGWRKEREDEEMAVNDVMGTLWLIFQPLLFSLIGAQIEISKLDPVVIGWSLIVLLIGLVFRMLTSAGVVFKLGLNWKEKLFIPLAWMPKATVQAAIGSLALDSARTAAEGGQVKSSHFTELASNVTTVASNINLTTIAPDMNTIATIGGPKTDIQLGEYVLQIAVLTIMVTAPIGAALMSLTAPRLLQKGTCKSMSQLRRKSISRDSSDDKEKTYLAANITSKTITTQDKLKDSKLDQNNEEVMNML